MRGRPPKPTKLRVLEGNPGKRRLGGEPQPNTPLRAPDLIAATPAADEEWRRAVSAMPPAFYSDADSPVLTVYCMSWVIYRNALATIAREGMITAGSMGQDAPHPAVAIVAKFAEKILQASDRLGMSPVARARIGPMLLPADPLDGDDDDLLRG